MPGGAGVGVATGGVVGVGVAVAPGFGVAVGVGVAFGESSPPAAGESVRGDGFAAGLSAPGFVGLAGVLVFFFGAFFLHGLAFAAWVLAVGHFDGLGLLDRRTADPGHREQDREPAHLNSLRAPAYPSPRTSVSIVGPPSSDCEFSSPSHSSSTAL